MASSNQKSCFLNALTKAESFRKLIGNWPSSDVGEVDAILTGHSGMSRSSTVGIAEERGL